MYILIASMDWKRHRMNDGVEKRVAQKGNLQFESGSLVSCQSHFLDKITAARVDPTLLAIQSCMSSPSLDIRRVDSVLLPPRESM
jgi:hypothetical protein